MRIIFTEPVRARLERTEEPGHRWLWCNQCERFFHASALERQREACPFPGCQGAGFDRDIYFWDAFREPGDPRWPTSTEELAHGMRSPDMEEYYAGLDREHRDHVLESFARSPERAALTASRDVSDCTRLVLEHADSLSVDPEDISADILADLLLDVPRLRECAIGGAGEIIRELRAFWTFAGRELRFEHAGECIAFLNDDAESMLEDAIWAVRAEHIQQCCSSSARIVH